MFALQIIAAFVLSTVVHAAEIPEGLAGTWTNPTLRLSIDVEQKMARVDDEAWQPLQVRDVSGKMIVFDVGREQFIGLVGDGSFTVTRMSDRVSQELVRSHLRSTLGN